MLFGCEVLGLEDGALMNEISVLVGRDMNQEIVLSLLCKATARTWSSSN
jgi:hypothetical protein